MSFEDQVRSIVPSAVFSLNLTAIDASQLVNFFILFYRELPPTLCPNDQCIERLRRMLPMFHRYVSTQLELLRKRRNILSDLASNIQVDVDRLLDAAKEKVEIDHRCNFVVGDCLFACLMTCHFLHLPNVAGNEEGVELEKEGNLGRTAEMKSKHQCAQFTKQLLANMNIATSNMTDMFYLETTKNPVISWERKLYFVDPHGCLYSTIQAVYHVWDYADPQVIPVVCESYLPSLQHPALAKKFFSSQFSPFSSSAATVFLHWAKNFDDFLCVPYVSEVESIRVLEKMQFLPIRVIIYNVPLSVQPLFSRWNASTALPSRHEKFRFALLVPSGETPSWCSPEYHVPIRCAPDLHSDEVLNFCQAQVFGLVEPQLEASYRQMLEATATSQKKIYQLHQEHYLLGSSQQLTKEKKEELNVLILFQTHLVEKFLEKLQEISLKRLQYQPVTQIGIHLYQIRVVQMEYELSTETGCSPLAAGEEDAQHKADDNDGNLKLRMFPSIFEFFGAFVLSQIRAHMKLDRSKVVSRLTNAESLLRLSSFAKTPASQLENEASQPLEASEKESMALSYFLIEQFFQAFGGASVVVASWRAATGRSMRGHCHNNDEMTGRPFHGNHQPLIPEELYLEFVSLYGGPTLIQQTEMDENYEKESQLLNAFTTVLEDVVVPASNQHVACVDENLGEYAEWIERYRNIESRLPQIQSHLEQVIASCLWVLHPQRCQDDVDNTKECLNIKLLVTYPQGLHDAWMRLLTAVQINVHEHFLLLRMKNVELFRQQSEKINQECEALYLEFWKRQRGGTAELNAHWILEEAKPKVVKMLSEAESLKKIGKRGETPLQLDEVAVLVLKEAVLPSDTALE